MLDNVTSVLVTGGAGFVGSAVVDALLQHTSVSEVHVVDNLFNGKESFVPRTPRVAFERVDITDREAVRCLVERVRPQVVIHLAALHYIPYCDANPAETMSVNVVGTQHLLDACFEHPPNVVVAASTVAVYPVCDQATDESVVPDPVDIYGLSKWCNERQVELFSRKVSTRCAMVRLCNVYGPRETNPHVIPEILKQTLQGQLEICLGNVKPKRDYIYVGDVASGILAIAEGNESRFRVYNVGTGEEHSVEEIVRQLSEISGRALQVKVDPARVRKTDRMHLVSDLSRIRSEIGWVPEFSIQRGLESLWQSVSRRGE